MSTDIGTMSSCWDWRVPSEVQEAARAAEPGGMKANTEFCMVPTQEGNELLRPKNMREDDPYHILFHWHCSKPFQVGERHFLYQYWHDAQFFGPLCLIYGPAVTSP